MEDKSTLLIRALELAKAYMVGFSGFMLPSDFVSQSMLTLMYKKPVECKGEELTLRLALASLDNVALVNAIVGNGTQRSALASATTTTLSGILRYSFGQDRTQVQQLLWAYCEGLSHNRLPAEGQRSIMRVDNNSTCIDIPFRYGPEATKFSLQIAYIGTKYVASCSSVRRVKTELGALLNPPKEKKDQPKS